MCEFAPACTDIAKGLEGHVGRWTVAVVVTLLALVIVPVTGVAQDVSSDDAVTIRTGVMDLAVGGDFEVVDGAVSLGCLRGAVTGATMSGGGRIETLESWFTCESGPKTGSFAVKFFLERPLADIGSDEVRGPWEVTGGTGDFEGLVGRGDYAAVFTNGVAFEVTYTGTIQVVGGQQTLAATGVESGMVAVIGFGVLAAGLMVLVADRRPIR